MKMLLDEKETQKWLHMRECEKTLEKTSRLPEGFKCSPEGQQEMEEAKVRTINWPSHHKAEIMAMVAEGKFPREIAKILGLNESSVKHLVYSEKKVAKRRGSKRHVASLSFDGGIGATYIEAHQEPIAEGNKPPIVIAPDRPESTTKAIRAALAGMVKRECSVTYIMGELNRNFGTNYTQDDIVQMRSEL